MKIIMTLLSVCLFFNLNTALAVTTVDQVDLNRYKGQWYEVASMPQWFQKKCAKNVMAQYNLKTSGRVEVVNSCLTGDDQRTETIGEAKTKNESNSKLKVTFVKIFGQYIYSFGGDYWVIDLDSNYNYSVVGHPTREYGWILARKPWLPDADLLRIAENLKAQGYDTCKFNMTIQDIGNSKKITLCEYLKSL